MAKVVSVSVGLGRTYNVGNYESMRIDVTEVRELEAGDNVDDVYKETVQSAKLHLVETYNDLMGAKG